LRRAHCKGPIDSDDSQVQDQPSRSIAVRTSTQRRNKFPVGYSRNSTDVEKSRDAFCAVSGIKQTRKSKQRLEGMTVKKV